jgi:hypothetical protein
MYVKKIRLFFLVFYFIFLCEKWRNFLLIPSEFSDTGFVAGNFRNMDVMRWNERMEPFDELAKDKNSQNIVKSRRATERERQAEYDYYEDIISTSKKP